MTPTDRLTVVEEIKVLKARYFRHLDLQDWAAYAGVFSPDATLEVQSIRRGDGEARPISRRETGPAAIVAWVSAVLDGAVTVHHGHMPEIEIQSADRATGIWAMEDRVDWPDRSIHGWGHYHETYVREADGWKIATSTLTRLRVDVWSGDGASDATQPQMLDAGGASG